MSSPPTTRRHTPLDERLRLLDDIFIPTPTPTNTWLDNVQPSDESDEDDFDNEASTKEDYDSDHRRNRFEELRKSTRSTSQSEKKTYLPRISPEPRSSSLPPGTHNASESHCLRYSCVAADHETSRAEPARSPSEHLFDTEYALRQAAIDP